MDLILLFILFYLCKKIKKEQTKTNGDCVALKHFTLFFIVYLFVLYFIYICAKTLSKILKWKKKVRIF